MIDLRNEIEHIFSPDGPLASLTGFEHRPQQTAMALAVADALTFRRHLVVEAPTGVGKSLAYLIPAMLFAQHSKQKAIIATHTKNLQEQLWKKDVEIAKAVIKPRAYEPGADESKAFEKKNRRFADKSTALDDEDPLKPMTGGLQDKLKLVQQSHLRTPHSALLKGRRNYLCTTRLRNARLQPKLIFEGDRSDILQRIADWAEVTPDGDLENAPFPIPPDVAARICSESGICSSKNCGPDCFFQRAKRIAREADIVIVNHALFFTLMALRPTQEYFLFPDDFVIFDEAHLLEQSASLGVGGSLSRNQVLYAVHRLFNPRSRKGLLSRQRTPGLKKQCEDADEAVDAFFDAITDVSRRAVSKGQSCWWRTPPPVSDTVSHHLHGLQKIIADLLEKKTVRIPQEELQSARRLLSESEMAIRRFLSQDDESLTYWVDIPPGKGTNTILQMAPTNVAESVGPLLFRDNVPVILTSATLGVGGDLSYFRNRVGAHHAGSLTVDSPFDFRKQMRIVLAGDMPQPDDPRYEDALPEWILRSIKRTHGRSLVLFTNASLMRRMADILREPLEELGIPLLVQQSGASRHGLLEEFKADVDSVLFGLDSFWMGVDVPGEALQHVIITRLPFAVPDHPLIQARMVELEQQGEQPFFSYSLPEAVLKLRQGVGRLIRRSDDTGIVTILDSRIVRKSYGQIFVKSLPQCRIEILKENGDIEDAVSPNAVED